jgi:hypothetical protein
LLLVPISQLLRYKSRELDSSETIEAIGIGKDDEIECEELEEGEMGVDMGGRMEGFGGTALVGNAACPQCTLLNPNGSATLVSHQFTMKGCPLAQGL